MNPRGMSCVVCSTPVGEDALHIYEDIHYTGWTVHVECVDKFSVKDRGHTAVKAVIAFNQLITQGG